MGRRPGGRALLAVLGAAAWLGASPATADDAASPLAEEDAAAVALSRSDDAAGALSGSDDAGVATSGSDDAGVALAGSDDAAVSTEVEDSESPLADPGPATVESAMLESDALFEDDFDLPSEGATHDPFERVNRNIFRGNRVLDRMLLDPLTEGYRFLLPGPVRRSIRGVFENLGSPGVIVNDLLQGEPALARDASARFVVNTTVGLAGIWDPATRLGWEAHSSDFGQTLGRAGWQTGPYLVLPVFGPNTTRDLVGDVVDLALRPDTWLLPLASRLVIGSTDGISTRDANIEALNALEASSVDFYAAMRSAFLMNREAFVTERDVSPESTRPGPAPVSPASDTPPVGAPPVGAPALDAPLPLP